MARSMKIMNKVLTDPKLQPLHISNSLTTLMMDYLQG